jgi:hypothetical protein
VFSSVAQSASSQVLVSTAPNTYAFIPSSVQTSPAFGNGIIQMQMVTYGPGGSYPRLPVLPVGDSTSDYNAAGLVLQTTFTPTAQSRIVLEYCVTASANNGTVYINAYADPIQLPAPFASGSLLTCLGTETLVSSIYGGFSSGDLFFSDPLTVSLCAFGSAGATIASAANVNDYLLIWSFDDASSNQQTATATSISAVPVPLFTISTSNPPPTSVVVIGTVAFFDAANSVGNTQTLLFAVENNSGTAVVVNGPVQSAVAIPSLTYDVSGGDVTVNVVGQTGVTYNCAAQLQQIQGGI